MSILIDYIGIIHTPFKTKEGMPIQSYGATGNKGYIVLNPKFVEGLKSLDGFSHIILIYAFHKSQSYDLHTVPFLDNQQHGVFATRAPKRPNPVGFSVVKLLKIENNLIFIENVDMLDQTPLIDIKPYVPAFDVWQTDKIGWLTDKNLQQNNTKSDNRFD